MLLSLLKPAPPCEPASPKVNVAIGHCWSGPEFVYLVYLVVYSYLVYLVVYSYNMYFYMGIDKIMQ